MKRARYVLMIFSIMFFSVQSCKKNDKPDSGSTSTTAGSVKLSSKATIVDSLSILYMDSSKVSISKNGKEKKHAIGDILIIRPNLFTQYADFRKITKVTETAVDYLYDTEEGSLNEAFEKLVLSDSTVFNTTQHANARMQGESDLSLDLNRKLSDKVLLKGKLKVKMTKFVFDYEKSSGILPSRILLQADFTTEGSEVEVTNRDASPFEFGETVLYTFPLPTIIIDLPIPTEFGIITLPVSFGQEVALKTGPVKFTGRVKYTCPYGITTTLGAKYEAGSWSDISKINLGTLEKPDAVCQSNFSVGAGVEYTMVEAEYALKPLNLNLLKATLGIAEKISLTTQSATPQWKVDASTKIEGKIKTDFFTGEKTVLSIGGSTEFGKSSIEGNFATSGCLKSEVLGKWIFVKTVDEYSENGIQHTDVENGNGNQYVEFDSTGSYTVYDPLETPTICKGTWDVNEVDPSVIMAGCDNDGVQKIIRIDDTEFVLSNTSVWGTGYETVTMYLKRE